MKTIHTQPSACSVTDRHRDSRRSVMSLSARSGEEGGGGPKLEYEEAGEK